MTTPIPKTQQAVQLTGPDQLCVNPAKPIFLPGPHQVLCRTEAVGLCFSDLKLLKQFTAHVRKSEVVSGVAPEVLRQVPSYVPGERPTVPGHEATARIVAAGPGARHRVGERVLIQADYRWVRTRDSNAAFGYNFEGALQEYFLVDERVAIAPDGESTLIAADENFSASAIALCEPWGCVENAYVSPERRAALAGGRMLVICDEGRAAQGVAETFDPAAPPARIVAVGEGLRETALRGTKIERAASLEALAAETFDDILYFGSRPEIIEAAEKRLAPHGLLNIVLGGHKIGRLVSYGVGRVHYGGTRLVGTAGHNAAESLKAIPPTGEIRPGEKLFIVGAAGPMGMMHVIRDLCQGVADIELTATDMDDARLAVLDAKAAPLANARGLAYRSLNPQKRAERVEATYTALMVPVPALLAKAIVESRPAGLINIFAGIPATVYHDIDLDAYIAKGLYMIGTSGSLVRDMRIVLDKVVSGRLDTNLSVGAVSGIAGAIDGIRAVENRTISGKIIVYPALHDLPLTPLEDLRKTHPHVHARLDNGQWTKAAEDALLAGAR